MDFRPGFSCVLWLVITQISFAQFIKDWEEELILSVHKPHKWEGGGEAVGNVLQPGLSAV